MTTFKEFWPYYAGEHKLPATRALHFVGTSLHLLALVGFFVTLDWHFLPLSVVSGYLFAWIGHFFVEKNRPATFSYPLFSLAGDYKMYALMWVGRMSAEVERLHGNAAASTSTSAKAA
jgi:hypothetical protein